MSDSRVREEHGVLEGWVSILINVVVFAVKIVPGVLIGSVSLIADAVHSLGDVASSGVVIWGFKVAAKPSDREHPFGHGRFENVAALVISVMLVITGWEFGQASFERLLHPRAVHAPPWLLVVLALSMVLKEWLSRFSRDLGRRIGSDVLIADFWHHRSDVLATGVVIAALAASNRDLRLVDGVAGLIISGFIGWAAIRLLKDSVDPLIGQAPSAETLQAMREAALSVTPVEKVHDLVVHRYGALNVMSLHVEVPDDLDVARAHEVAEAVEQALSDRLGGSAVVHVDPINRRHPLYVEVETFLGSMASSMPGATRVHDLRIVGHEAPCYVLFDLATDAADVQPVAQRLREAIMQRFPGVAKVVVNVEPRYVY